MLPKASAYVKSYDGQTKWMYFFIENYDLLEKYNTIWDKVSADIKKELDCELVYNKHFLKTKIKSNVMKLQIFTIKKFLTWIFMIFALKKDENYYPQVFLKECKYI